MPTPARPSLLRQTITVTVTTKNGVRPRTAVRRAVDGDPDVVTFETALDEDAEVVPGPDVPRLIQLAQWVAGEDAKRRLGLPSEWDQRKWLRRASCGTACCIAGKVALDAGGLPVAERWDPVAQQAVVASANWDADNVRLPDSDRIVPVADFARDALGLNHAQAGALFSATNSLDTILRVIKGIIDEVDGESAPEPTPTLPPPPAVTVRRPPAVTVRRRRPNAWSGCGMGESCNWCYETVPVDDVPF